jgi:tetratricopeptide (TPR) repeat protein
VTGDLLARAELLRSAGDHAAAVAVLLEAVTVDPFDAEAYAFLADVLQRDGDYNGTYAVQSLVDDGRDGSLNAFEVGVVLEKFQLREPAVRAFREALSRADDGDEVWMALYGLGAALVLAGEYREAIDHLNRALADHQPGWPPALASLAVALEGVGDRQAALAMMSETIRRDPEYFEWRTEYDSPLLHDFDSERALLR